MKSNMHEGFLKTAAVLGAVSVALGAFAAHTLKKMLPEYSLSIFETGVKYQFYHVFALLFTALLFGHYSRLLTLWAGRLFIAGIFLFSGSLYVLALAQSSTQSLNWIGMITPFGGVCFIAGWICLFASFTRKYDRRVDVPR